ncbi:SsgA family sporulation/cell division regulator [Streptomyces sp. RFCAC02]|uniref:SsgA family sporulation/cell division regulator n=1 Tax=Streptomyces sp. RFCAC02 TaxID=2499143 RepID=UPI00102234AF|nr:SsgA family sporulation/cell division regulator [Streptomyces sp. RFCAC02]
MVTIIARELEVELVLSPERSVPVPARLVYRADDPYAVHMTFHIGSDIPVHWTFGRDLLVEGVERACGEGDVRVWPSGPQHRRSLFLALRSPDGDALLRASAPEVAEWLERTLRAVPPGEESDRIDADEVLYALLTARPADDSGDGRR